jgi:hypothetical protein
MKGPTIIKRLIEYIKKNKDNLPDFKDLLLTAGLIMALRGLYLIYPPAMWIIGGIFIIYLGWPQRVVK